MSERRRSSFGAQSPRVNREQEIEELLEISDRLIDSLNSTTASNGSTDRSLAASVVRVSLNGSGNTSGGSEIYADPLNYLSDERLDAEIQRIHQYCENIDSNLARIGMGSSMSANSGESSNEVSFVSSSTPQPRRVANAEPVEIIDLSTVEYHGPLANNLNTNHDPVAVIDLCTPEASRNARRAAANTLNRDQSPRQVRRRRRRSLLEELSSVEEPRSPPAEPTESTEPKQSRLANSSQSDNSYQCPVCLEGVRQRQPMATKCGHVFCTNCIQGAIRMTHKCPLCNKKLSIRQICRIYL